MLDGEREQEEDRYRDKQATDQEILDLLSPFVA